MLYHNMSAILLKFTKHLFIKKHIKKNCLFLQSMIALLISQCYITIKICIIEVYIIKYYFECHLMYKWRCNRQTIFNQLNNMVPYVYIIGLCHNIVILWEIFVMQHKCHVKGHNFHFKLMLITRLGQ